MCRRRMACREPSELTVAGPLGHTAGDIELALDVTVGLDGPMRQAMQIQLQGPRHATPQGLRVGLWPGDAACEVENAFSSAIEDAGKALEKQGASLQTISPDFDKPQHFETYMKRLSAIVGSDMPQPVFAAMQDIVDAAEADDTSMRVTQARGITLSHGEWLRLNIRKAKMIWHGMVFEKVDVLLCPVTPSTAMKHDHNPDFHARTITGTARRGLISTISFGPVSPPYADCLQPLCRLACMMACPWHANYRPGL